MKPTLNETHDASVQSWVDSANRTGADFPIQNLPFGAFRRAGSQDAFRVGVAIGDFVLDVAACVDPLDATASDAAKACAAPVLNPLMALGRDAWSALRRALFEGLRAGSKKRSALEPHLVALSAVEMALPVSVPNFTDFYASINHATNAGRMFRPDEPLLPNYKHVPIAYNGRRSTVRLGGETVTRPCGQINAGGAGPVFQAARSLDFEVELGVYLGEASHWGVPVGIGDAGAHIFGYSLLNDWSARDIQAWEYRPLGPYLAKTFATSVAPWIVTAEALAPYAVPAPARPSGDPQPLPYLTDEGDRAHGGLDMVMETFLRTPGMIERGLPPERIARVRTSEGLYWTVAQMIAHQTSNGCNIEVGDLFGTGTISGTTPDSLGSMLEITRRGESPLQLPDGETRVFLEDGDEVTMTGYCERDGAARIGFGRLTSVIGAARADIGLRNGAAA